MIAPLIALLGLAHARTLAEEPAPAPAAVEPAPAGPDRSAPPAVRPSAPLARPEPVTRALRDGLTVRQVTVEGLRKVQIVVSLHRGSVALCGGPAPRCAALGDMLGVATASMSAAELEEALTLLDAELYGSTGLRDLTLTLAVPPERLDEGLALLREALVNPRFPKDELALHKRDMLVQYRATWPADGDVVAMRAREHGWFPADSPYGARPDLEAWERLKAKDLVRTWETALAEAPATVLVVSGLPWEQLEGRLSAALEGVGRPGERAAPLPFAPPARTRVLAVDMPGQSLAKLRLRVAAPAGPSAERPSFQALHFALGGSFLSRINENLREEKGWTYGAYGRYTAMPAYGAWDVGVDVAAENAAEAIREIETEIAEIVASGPTEAELDAAAVDSVQAWNERLATSDSARGWYQAMLDQDDSVERGRARLDALAGLGVEDARALAGRVLGAEAPRLWVVVGDRATLEAELQALGWTAEWVSASDAVLGRLP